MGTTWSASELQTKLEEFHMRTVHVDGRIVQKEYDTAVDVANILVNAINNDENPIKIQMQLQGSARDDLKVNNGGDYDFLLTVRDSVKITVHKGTGESSDLCRRIPKGYTLLEHTAPWFGEDVIMKTSKPLLTSRKGKNYINPINFKRHFISRFQRVREQFERNLKAKGYKFQSRSEGDYSPAIQYEIQFWNKTGWIYGGEWRTVAIDLVPAIRNNVAKQPNNWYDELNELLWKESFTTAETTDLERLSIEQKECIRLLKAIRNRHENMQWMSSYLFKTVAIHLYRSGNWMASGGRNSQAELFTMYMDKLITDLESGTINAPYVHDNLLQPYTSNPAPLNQVATYLKRCRKNGYINLLE